ncbi:putative perakine reductase [Rosa chinensis]|uniref:Putative perakine reductase n=1 Tax=Rosa chinensis TaxID=74649 RepID=A0A2P6QPK4_ROSCH|nr:putative perakine reductase [Rosa chinensis]
MEHKSDIEIPKVKLGSQGLEIGFWICGGLSGIYNAPLSHEAGCSVIKEAFNRGITFYDTADAYGQDHDSEILVGKALKQLPRENVQLATKFGIFQSESFEFSVNGTPEYHRVNVSVPIEDTIGELVNEGKIRYIGLSEASIDTITRAHAVHPITSVQMDYSLWTREIENEIISLCRLVKFSPLNSTISNSSYFINSKTWIRNHASTFTGNLELG